MRKILIVTHDLLVGGMQRFVVNLAVALKKKKYVVHVCVLRDSGHLEDELYKSGIEVYRIKQISDKGKVNYLSFLDVYKLVRKNKYDIIHTNNTNSFIDGGLAAIMSGVPRIHTDHAREFPDKIKYMVVERILSQFYCKVIAVSRELKSNLMSYEKIPERKILVVENGVPQIPRQAHGVRHSGENLVFGAIGRFSDEKGFSYLVKSFYQANLKYPNIKLILAGSGPLFGEISGLISELGIENSVKLMGEVDDPSCFYSQIDVLVIPSLREGLPLVLLEAMSAAKIIMSSHIGGIPDVIKNFKSGLLFAPGDIQEMACRMEELILDYDLCSRLSTSSQKLYLKRFSIDIMVDKYEKIYHECL